MSARRRLPPELQPVAEAARRLGHSPTVRAYDAVARTLRTAHRSIPSAQYLYLRYGSWDTVLAAGGLPSSGSQRRRWRDDEILDAVWDVARCTRGRLLLCTEYEWAASRAGLPNLSVVLRRFGSWTNAVQAAGVAEAPVRHPISRGRWSDADLIRALRASSGDNELGPTVDAYRRWQDHRPAVRPGCGVIRARFGMWNRALEAAGLRWRAPRGAADPLVRRATSMPNSRRGDGRQR